MSARSTRRRDAKTQPFVFEAIALLLDAALLARQRLQLGAIHRRDLLGIEQQGSRAEKLGQGVAEHRAAHA